jgi:hypothetical protein
LFPPFRGWFGVCFKGRGQGSDGPLEYQALPGQWKAGREAAIGGSGPRPAERASGGRRQEARGERRLHCAPSGRSAPRAVQAPRTQPPHPGWCGPLATSPPIPLSHPPTPIRPPLAGPVSVDGRVGGPPD